MKENKFSPEQRKQLKELAAKVRAHNDEGRKFDAGKAQYGLLPPDALRQTVEVLTFGAAKYAPDNWRYVPEAKRRYFDAAQRHLWAWKGGEETDGETGNSHLAHAICCLMFLLEVKE